MPPSFTQLISRCRLFNLKFHVRFLATIIAFFLLVIIVHNLRVISDDHHIFRSLRDKLYNTFNANDSLLFNVHTPNTFNSNIATSADTYAPIFESSGQNVKTSSAHTPISESSSQNVKTSSAHNPFSQRSGQNVKTSSAHTPISERSGQNVKTSSAHTPISESSGQNVKTSGAHTPISERSGQNAKTSSVHTPISESSVYDPTFSIDAENVHNDRGLITVSLTYRLGNLMFQYATLIGAAQRHGMIPFLPTGVEEGPSRHAYMLQDVFKIPTPERNWSSLQNPVTYREKRAMTYFDVLQHVDAGRDAILVGYFQSWKYFQHVKEDLIQKHFVLRDALNISAQNYIRKALKEMGFEGAVLVGVHVRRGDFILANSKARGREVPGTSYFRRSMNYFRGKYRNVVFIVCSDDKMWVTENLSNGRDVHVSTVEDFAMDFAILVNCDHMIMSVGTFSWWAGYLVQGEVIYYAGYPRPNSFLGNITVKGDLYLPSWKGSL